jgi:stage II sporulation protein D
MARRKSGRRAADPDRRRVPLAALAAALAWLLAFAPHASAQAGNFTSIYVARWNLTHGKYLVDIGEYLEALEAFDTAVEMTDNADVRTDALLQKANVLALFLDAPDDAIRVYDDLSAHNPTATAAEAALYRAGMVLFDRQQYGRAAGYFERYLKEHPTGASHGLVEFVLQACRSKAAGQPTAAQATAAPPTPAVAAALPTAPGPTAPLPPPSGVATARTTGEPSTAEVRVRIFKGHSSVRVESDGALSIMPGPLTGHAVELTARGGLVAAGTETAVPWISISADKPLQITAKGMKRHYRGGLKLRANGNTLVIVNSVGIEPYLYGVVTKESAPSWPLEALKTQAIASRTYALYQVQHRRDREYDMVDDEGSQVYGGVEGESSAGRRAVDETRGMILEYHGRLVYAMFTANTGWYTADSASVFDQPLPYLIAQPDAYSPDQQMGHWTRSFSAGEIHRKLADIGVNLGSIRAIEPHATGPSGRIIRVAIVDEHGAHVMRTRPTLGRALKLPEILLKVEHKGDAFVFAGGGLGHGVGLSQWGAKAMAAKGLSAKDILAFYYHGAEIAPMTQ